MSKSEQPGWTETPHRTTRKGKRKSRTNLNNALAHAKDRYQDGVERATKALLRDVQWWEGLTEEQRKPHLDGSIRRFGAPVPPPHPDTPEGQALIRKNPTVRLWAKQIAKFERELASL